MKRYTREEKTIITLTFTLIVLLTMTSLIGLFKSDFYAAETANWKLQTRAQDIFDLVVIVPLLVYSLVMALAGRQIGLWVWGGINLYLIYTFVIYCFDIHFNSLFIFYCLILGIVFYSFVIFLGNEFLKSLFFEYKPDAYTIKLTGIFFIVIALLFAFLWLSDDLSAIREHRVPDSLIEVGLPTNPVHVLDLGIILPGLFITGILLLIKKNVAFFLAPVLLIFLILMSLTIAGIMLLQRYYDEEASMLVVIVMLTLATFSNVLLLRFMKSQSSV